MTEIEFIKKFFTFHSVDVSSLKSRFTHTPIELMSFIKENGYPDFSNENWRIYPIESFKEISILDEGFIKIYEHYSTFSILIRISNGTIWYANKNEIDGGIMIAKSFSNFLYRMAHISNLLTQMKQLESMEGFRYDEIVYMNVYREIHDLIHNVKMLIEDGGMTEIDAFWNSYLDGFDEYLNFTI